MMHCNGIQSQLSSKFHLFHEFGFAASAGGTLRRRRDLEFTHNRPYRGHEA